MTPPTPVTVPRSLPGFLWRVVLLPVGVAAALAVSAAGALSAVCFLVMAVSGRPRVVVAPEGFAFDKLFGSLARKWHEIDGPFAVIKIGWSNAVAYKLTADFKASVGKKPTSLFSGYDEVIVGVFQLSAENLAELLNERRRAFASSSLRG